MADPVSLAVMGGVALGGQILGAATAGVGTSQKVAAAQLEAEGAQVQKAGAQFQAIAESNAYTYRAGIAQLNKKIANQNADYAVAVGETKAQVAAMQNRWQVGQIRAAQGASGLDVHGETSQAVVGSQQEIGEQNEAQIRSDAAREAYGYKVEGMSAEAESQMETVAARNALTSGQVEALGYDIKSQAAGLKGEQAITEGAGSILGGISGAGKLGTELSLKGVFA